ncbi:E3 ubiquitin-protein ligase TRIM35 isoform X3 [Maylandia zebra]|uniref:E3 ubiquitin-protein ligase TRIM35 isoform X3 n=1 Tax=Maylandia zebra TaxID=106582 RepID=UPI00403D46B1
MSTTNQDKCFLHNQKRNSFCHNDEELVCLVCQQSKEHKVHVCCPVEEAAEQKKTEISASLESLKKKLKVLINTKEQWEEIKTHIQTQACETETGIKEEFKKLHQFLKEEENTRLQALKQEEETKTQIMCMKLENIEEQINTLSSTINDIETALKAQDVQLLQDYKKTKKMLQWKIGEPEVIRVYHLINSAKHLGSLKFSHLEEGGRHCQMCSCCFGSKHCPFQLTLKNCPVCNTAARSSYPTIPNALSAVFLCWEPLVLHLESTVGL